MTTLDKSTKLYSTFDPRITANCVLWLDAADRSSLTLSGSNVTAWRDKSVKGYNATSSGTSPLVSNKLNNLPGIQFTGTNYFTGTASNTGTTVSVFAVAEMSSSSTQYARIVSFSSSAQNDYDNIARCVPIVRNINNQAIQGYRNLDLGNVSITYNSAFVASSIFDNSNHNIYRNGNVGTTVASTGSFNYSLYAIGNSAGNNSSSYLTGYVYEVIVFNSALTTTQRQQIEGYLANKWGLQASLSAGHPYISRGPYLSILRPTDITNCALWLDGADASTITGTTNVTQWNDKSGNGRNFTATTGPSYSSNTMTFNGSTQKMGNTAWNNFSRINHTLIAVHKPDTNSAYVGNTRLFSIQQTAGNPYVVFPYLNNTTPNGYINDGNASTNPAASGKTLLDNSSTSAYNIITASISGSAQVIYNNGTVQDTRAYTITNSTVTTGVNIGGQYLEWYKGSVKEIIIYTSALSVTDVNTIEGYLAWKWGLQGSLDANHPYKNFYPLKIN